MALFIAIWSALVGKTSSVTPGEALVETTSGDNLLETTTGETLTET